MKIRHAQQGFTIIEVLIAIAILTIGILTMITMQATSIKGNATANIITEATAWGADEIEQLFAMKYSDTTYLKDTDDDKLAGLSDAECCEDGKNPAGVTVSGCAARADACPPPQGDYFIYLNVAEKQPLTKAETTKTIRVIVKRNDVKGNAHTVTFDYYRSLAL